MVRFNCNFTFLPHLYPLLMWSGICWAVFVRGNTFQCQHHIHSKAHKWKMYLALYIYMWKRYYVTCNSRLVNMHKIHFTSIGAFWYRISDGTNIYTTILTHLLTVLNKLKKNYNWLYKYVLVDDGCVAFMLCTLIWKFTNHKAIFSSTYLQKENFEKI